MDVRTVPKYQKKSDVITINEFLKELDNTKLEHLFTDKEIDKFGRHKSYKSLAGRYLIKKIIIEHLKCGDHFRQIEILSTESGKPQVVIFGLVKRSGELVNLKAIDSSISHSRKFVSAMVVFSF